MPRNLIRLVKDGAGGGTLEIDTAVASRIDAFYVVDVAICAVLLAAAADDKDRNIERFEAPPSLAPQSPSSPKSIRSPIIGMGKFTKIGKRDRDTERESKIEEFEMDLESQESLKEKVKGKDKKKKDGEEKIPGFFGLVWMLLKFFLWFITVFFKGIAKVIIWLSSCLTSKSKS